MRILLVIVSVYFFKSCEGQCTLPNNLTGTFISSSKGVLEFTSNSISGYTVSNFGSFEFNCTISFASKLIFRSTTFSYLGLTWEAYLCLDITTISQDLFVYNLNSVEEPDAQNERVKIFVQGTNPSVLNICDRTSIPSGSYELLIRNGTGSTSKQACSSDLEGYWSYSIDNGNNDNCTNQTTSLDVCSDPSTLEFNYTACPTLIAYSASGKLNCLQEISSGSVKYLTLFNTDQSTDESTTYKVTCMVYEVTNSGISMTQYPQACLSNQTSTTVISPGSALTLFNRQSCPVTTEAPILVSAATASWVYAVVVLIVIIVIVFIIIIGIKAYKKHKESKDESRGIKPDTETVTVVEEGQDVKDGTSNTDMPPDILNYLQKEHSMANSSGSGKDDDIQITLSTPVQPFREEESPGPHTMELPGAVTDYHTIGGVPHPSSPRPPKKTGGTAQKTTPRTTPRNTPRTPKGGIVPRSISNLSLTKNSPRTPRSNGAKSITPRGATVKPIDSQPRVKKGVSTVMVPATNDLGRGRRLPPIVESVMANNRFKKTKGVNAKRGSNIDKKVKTIERADSAKSTTSRESIDSLTNPRSKSRSVSFRQDVEAKKKAKKMKSLSSMNQSFDEDEIILPPNISQMKITRVDIPALALRTSESDMRLQEIESPKQMVWSTDDNDKVEDVEAGITIRKVWLEPDDPTDEIWARVSSLWRLGQTWTDKTINM